MIELDEGVYCFERQTKSDYQLVISCVDSYFYRPKLKYSLEELTGLVQRELGRKWKGLPNGFVEKVLYLSPSYHLRKERDGHLWVRAC